MTSDSIEMIFFFLTLCKNDEVAGCEVMIE